MVRQMEEEVKAAGFPCDCRADPDTATYPTAEGDKQLTKHMSQWASYNGCYQVFENSRGEVVPSRKGY